MFQFSRRSTNGTSLPSWLLAPGPVYLKRHIRSSKYDPVVDEVELLEANTQYAHVRMPDGRQSTVSLRHLAPVGDERLFESSSETSTTLEEDSSQSTSDTVVPDEATSLETTTQPEPIIQQNHPTPFVRTSSNNLRSGHST